MNIKPVAKKVGLVAAIVALTTATLVFSLIGVVVCLASSASRKGLDYALNTLTRKEEGSEKSWMFVHPVDILLSLKDIVKPPKSKSEIVDSFQRSDISSLVGERQADGSDQRESSDSEELSDEEKGGDKSSLAQAGSSK